MDENYELKGSVRKLEQRRQFKPLTPNLDRFREHESFDVELSPAGQVQNLTTYTRTGALHSFERYVYDQAGNRIHTSTFDSAGAQTSSMDFVYDKERGRVEWIIRDSSRVSTGRGVEEFRGELLMSHATFRPNGLPIFLKTFEYVGGSLLKSVSQYFGSDGQLSERWLSAYNAQGRVEETFGLKPDGSPLGDGRYTYEYDKEGRKYRVLSFNEWSDEDVPNHASDFIYQCDEHGNWIERREYSKFKSDSQWRETLTLRKLEYYLPR